jgi:NAD+ synthase (glutamine-hydrolysing)
MRLALAQTNPTVGDLPANARAMRDAIDRLARHPAGAPSLVVFPELAICGYPPRDLLLREGFVEACERFAREVACAAPPGVTVVVGTPARAGRRTANALLAGRDGRVLATYHKRLLPNYDVFDEERYFVSGHEACVIDVQGVPVGLSICEDLWRGEDVGFSDRYLHAPDPVEELVRAGARVIVNPSASPFRVGIGRRHRDLLRAHAQQHGVCVCAVNQVGGNDELVFDGSACAFGPDGRLLGAGPSFVTAETVVDLSDASAPVAPRAGEAVIDQLTAMSDEEALFRALVLGVRDYCAKTGFKSAVLGLSGGIDSAVVGVLAAAALGPARVLGVCLPSRYSSPGSLTDARELAARLGVRCDTIAIEGLFVALQEALRDSFAGTPPGVAEENLQSRLRGTILMALSNKHGHLLLTTGNKSELAVGYCTLYGDMNGGLAVISDVLKTRVYALARWMNAHWARLGIAGLAGPPIPQPSIDKAPSAELRPNQTDQDSLPPYDLLDEIVRRSVEAHESAQSVARAMHGRMGEDEVARVLRLIDISEFKRKQAAIGLKVSGVAFGSGRRAPIAARVRTEV